MKRICYLKSMFHFRFEWFIVKVSLKLMAAGGQDSWRLSEICQKREFSDRPVSGWGQRFGEVFWLLKMKSRSRKECHQREEEGRCWSRMRGGERMRQESHKTRRENRMNKNRSYRSQAENYSRKTKQTKATLIVLNLWANNSARCAAAGLWELHQAGEYDPRRMRKCFMLEVFKMYRWSA